MCNFVLLYIRKICEANVLGDNATEDLVMAYLA